MNQLLYPGIDSLQFSPTTHCDVLCIFMAITGFAKADDFFPLDQMGQKTNKQTSKKQNNNSNNNNNNKTRAHEDVVITVMSSCMCSWKVSGF